MPSAPLTRWWICRSRIGSKSGCIFRPAASTQIASGSAAPGCDAVDVRADDLDLAVVDLVQVGHGDELERRGLVAAELDMGIRFANPLALERRAIGHRDRHLGDLDLAAAHFQRLLDHRLVRHIRDNMLVGADARRQDLRDVRIGDDREAVVDGAGSRSVLVGRDFAQRQHEREDAVLVVFQVGGEVAGLDAAEGKGGAIGKAEGVNQRRHVASERHQPRVPAKLDAFFGQLLGELLAVGAAAHEDVEILLLQFLGDLHRDLIGRAPRR